MKKQATLIIVLFLSIIGFVFAQDAVTTQTKEKKEVTQEEGKTTIYKLPENMANGVYAVFETSMGTFVCKLFKDKTPITVDNFIGLATGTKAFMDSATWKEAKRPFYDGLIFHRVIPGFMVQGGCPLKNGTGDPGYRFKDEIVPELKHSKAGMLSMANAGPGTNGSQFFITVAPTPHLDGRHTIFGETVIGYDIVEKISQVQKDPRDKPLQDVVLIKVDIIEKKEGNILTNLRK